MVVMRRASRDGLTVFALIVVCVGCTVHSSTEAARVLDAGAAETGTAHLRGLRQSDAGSDAAAGASLGGVTGAAAGGAATYAGTMAAAAGGASTTGATGTAAPYVWTGGGAARAGGPPYVYRGAYPATGTGTGAAAGATGATASGTPYVYRGPMGTGAATAGSGAGTGAAGGTPYVWTGATAGAAAGATGATSPSGKMDPNWTPADTVDAASGQPLPVSATTPIVGGPPGGGANSGPYAGVSAAAAAGSNPYRGASLQSYGQYGVSEASPPPSYHYIAPPAPMLGQRHAGLVFGACVAGALVWFLCTSVFQVGQPTKEEDEAMRQRTGLVHNL